MSFAIDEPQVMSGTQLDGGDQTNGFRAGESGQQHDADDEKNVFMRAKKMVDTLHRAKKMDKQIGKR